MASNKIISTKAHQNALRRVVEHFGSQAALAAFLDVNPSIISHWCCGYSIIPIDKAEDICRSTGLFTILELRPDISKYKKYLN